MSSREGLRECPGASAQEAGNRGQAEQLPLTVYDEDGTILGEYFADLLVEHRLMVELKACQSVRDEHVAQLLGYLKSSRIETGLLVDFGAREASREKVIDDSQRALRRPFSCLLAFLVAPISLAMPLGFTAHSEAET